MSDVANLDRASSAWDALARCLVRRDDMLIVKDFPRRRARTAAVWPVGQVLAAAAACLPLGLVDRETVVGPLLRGLDRYRSAHGYAPFPGDRSRYYDDNAWIALDFLQLATLTGESDFVQRAEVVFDLLREGEAPGGGVRWLEGHESWNTCSTAPSAQVALRLFEATGDDRHLDFATQQMRWLDATLRDERGLYRDNVAVDGSIEPTVWSYNQGTPIGAAVLLARVTEDESWIERAAQTARAAAEHFGDGDGWWRQPPVFNAIYFRNLLALLAVEPDDALLGDLDRYLERVWIEAREPRIGLFVRGGIGSYDGRPAIDQAGLTQLFAFRSWPEARWPTIC
jgi:hypothetical protein